MRAGRGPGRAFTLVEVLVVIAILAILLAIMLPVAANTMASARSFKCQMSLRSTAFDFTVFADSELHGDRGDDPCEFGVDRFRLETFQESQYGIDEFWRYGDAMMHQVPDLDDNDPLRCPEVDGLLQLRRNAPCSEGGVGPDRAISFGFNLRLHRAETIDKLNRPLMKSVILSPEILGHGDVPLAWDVNGEQARVNRVPAVFSTPSLDSAGPLAHDRYWFPGLRHNGAINVAFVGGHVLSSNKPLEEPGWNWGFQTIR